MGEAESRVARPHGKGSGVVEIRASRVLGAEGVCFPNMTHRASVLTQRTVQRGSRHEAHGPPRVVEEQPDGGEERGHAPARPSDVG